MRRAPVRPARAVPGHGPRRRSLWRRHEVGLARRVGLKCPPLLGASKAATWCGPVGKPSTSNFTKICAIGSSLQSSYLDAAGHSLVGARLWAAINRASEPCSRKIRRWVEDGDHGQGPIQIREAGARVRTSVVAHPRHGNRDVEFCAESARIDRRWVWLPQLRQAAPSGGRSVSTPLTARTHKHTHSIPACAAYGYPQKPRWKYISCKLQVRTVDTDTATLQESSRAEPVSCRYCVPCTR